MDCEKGQKKHPAILRATLENIPNPDLTILPVNVVKWQRRRESNGPPSRLSFLEKVAADSAIGLSSFSAYRNRGLWKISFSARRTAMAGSFPIWKGSRWRFAISSTSILKSLILSRFLFFYSLYRLHSLHFRGPFYSLLFICISFLFHLFSPSDQPPILPPHHPSPAMSPSATESFSAPAQIFTFDGILSDFDGTIVDSTDGE